MRVTHDLGDGLRLALRTLDTVEEMHALTHEGVLASAVPLGDERLDVAIYGRTFGR